VRPLPNVFGPIRSVLAVFRRHLCFATALLENRAPLSRRRTDRDFTPLPMSRWRAARLKLTYSSHIINVATAAAFRQPTVRDVRGLVSADVKPVCADARAGSVRALRLISKGAFAQYRRPCHLRDGLHERSLMPPAPPLQPDAQVCS
jgi:hypothetical protein